MYPAPFAPSAARNRRVLVIDDNIAIHEDVRKILCPPDDPSSDAVSALEAELLGEDTSRPARPTLRFEVDSAHQGREGLGLVERAVAEGRPYAMAFVDVRMPPGWDGIETTLALWRAEPDLQIVICTAFSDYSWDDMLNRLGRSDRLVILRKPFDTIEVLQLANSLTEKWNLLQDTRQHERDLEERVRARTADLEAANAALQAEIIRRTEVEAALLRAKDAAESADRAKSAFLANMSHEIRTPMNGVIGMANLLLSTELNSEQSDYVRTLSQCCDSLLTIINDILDFSKIEAGRLEMEDIEFDLTDTVQLSIDLQAASAERKSIELVLNMDSAVPLFVRGDPVRLRQVLLNLVGNAVKFTHQGEVVVDVTALPPSHPGRTRLRFEIADTGIGISTEVQKTLFRPFVQEDSSTTRRFGGTGLGLAISKRLVEMMGGEIGLNSTPGRGSTFWFTVELDAATETNASITFLPLPICGRRVLAVDDCAPSRHLVGQLLSHWGAHCDLASNGETALAEMRRATTEGRPYALVVLDRHMPVMDGLALAAAIRADTTLTQPELVLLTSRSERLKAPQLAALQIDACEVKPIHTEKLRTTLGHLFTQRRHPEVGKPVAQQHPLKHSEPILVAEDNPANQKVIALTLRNLGYPCHVVTNGREALAALRERYFSLVLMDEHMPEMDGVEATRRIRSEANAGTLRVDNDIVIIATTADAMPGTRQRCLQAGMDDYLPKPIRLDSLAAMLAFHLRRKSAASETAVAAAN